MRSGNPDSIKKHKGTKQEPSDMNNQQKPGTAKNVTSNTQNITQEVQKAMQMNTQRRKPNKG